MMERELFDDCLDLYAEEHDDGPFHAQHVDDFDLECCLNDSDLREFLWQLMSLAGFASAYLEQYKVQQEQQNEDWKKTWRALLGGHDDT